MIKKYFRYSMLLLLLAIGVCSSCRKDMGNYEYTDVNEGVISNIEATYSALRGSVLTINPTLVFTKDDGKDTTKYTYAWYSIDESALPVTKKTIATTRNLNWTVSLASVNSAYTLIYEVREVSSGIIYRKSCKLTVTTNIADGWLVLNDINGTARLDFFNYLTATNDFQVYTDLLASQSTLKLTGKPKLVYFFQRRDPFSSVIARSIFVGTDQSTSIINTQNNTFSSFVNISTTISSYSPPPYYAERVASQASSYLAYLLDSNGELYFENATVGYAFGTRVNKTSNGVNFKISPYFAEAYRNGTTYALMYDIDNKRFMEHKSSNTSSSVPATSSTLFTPGNIGMDLLYMASTPAISSQTFALFKNSTNKIYLARIVCNSSTFSPQAFDEITTAPEMLNATQFAIDPTEGYVMYAVDSKIYRYNPFDKTNTMVLDLGSRKIALIKYQKMTYQPTNTRYAEYAKKLIVCTYDAANPSTTGTMDLYNVPSLNGALSPYKSFTGLGKVVDVSYRE